MPKVRREGRIVYIRKKNTEGNTQSGERTADGKPVSSILGEKVMQTPFKDWDDLELIERLQWVNMNYKSGAMEWTENCQRCVMATEMMMRGYDVEARPTAKNDVYSLFLMHNEQFKGQQWTAREELGKTKKTVLKNIVEMVKSWGDGARGMVVLRWQGTAWGHILNVVNRGGEVLFVDGQNSKIEEANSTQWWQYTKPSYTRISRVDNLEPWEMHLEKTTRRST